MRKDDLLWISTSLPLQQTGETVIKSHEHVTAQSMGRKEEDNHRMQNSEKTIEHAHTCYGWRTGSTWHYSSCSLRQTWRQVDVSMKTGWCVIHCATVLMAALLPWVCARCDHSLISVIESSVHCGLRRDDEMTRESHCRVSGEWVVG